MARVSVLGVESAPSNLVALGACLRAVRLERGLSQDRLAELSNVNRNYVGMVERGERNPSFLYLVRFADGLAVPIEELVAGLGGVRR